MCVCVKDGSRNYNGKASKYCGTAVEPSIVTMFVFECNVRELEKVKPIVRETRTDTES